MHNRVIDPDYENAKDGKHIVCEKRIMSSEPTVDEPE